MVFHLPSHEAGAPLELPARHPEISISRANSSQTDQTGKCSVAASQISGALIISLSASGSRRAPQLVPPSACRAIQPSAQSVKAPKRSKSHARTSCSEARSRRSGAPRTARIRVNRSAHRRQGAPKAQNACRWSGSQPMPWHCTCAAFPLKGGPTRPTSCHGCVGWPK